jgi:hypothetical protein
MARFSRGTALLFILSLPVFLSAQTPSITSLLPTSGGVGVPVTITGTNFGSSQGTSTVKFNGIAATPTTWTATKIIAPVPTGATTGNVVVTVGGQASSGVSFTVLASGPAITSLSPTYGGGGTVVTITGSNFGATKGTSTVSFHGTNVTPSSWSSTQIVATAASGNGNVVVSVGGVGSNAIWFPGPKINTLSPTSGAVGTSVTVSGNDFGTTAGTVTFNGVTASPTWGNNTITVPVPAGATTGPVLVWSSNGPVSNGVTFTVAPSITTLSPTSGAVGASVTITGANFGSTQGASTVKFNGTTATPSSWSATSIVAPVPTGATTGNVVVNANSMNSNGVSFTVVPAPSVSSLSPTTGAVGASVTITGTNFGSTQGTSTVKFSGTNATPSSWSATSIVAPVPSGATTGNVVVNASGVNSNGVSFTVAPSVSSLSPTTGAEGAPVTITGTNFGSTQGTSTVKFNGTNATPASWSATSIVVPVPSSATSGNVVVTVGGTASNPVNFAVTNSFTPTSNLNVAREFAMATLLNNDKVLLAGGSNNATAVLSSAELYDPIAGAFSFTGSLNIARFNSTAVLLTNGKVLIAGGYGTSVLATAELYDPSAGTFTATGSLNTARIFGTATLLPNGKVLIAGGETQVGSNFHDLASAELYDPSTGTFTVTGSLNTPSRFHTATLLNNGKVLIVGGYDDSGGSVLRRAELYDPSTGTFSVTGSLAVARFVHAATLLNTGKVLVAAGYDTNDDALSSAELYDPATGTFSATGNLNNASGSPTITLLTNGTVLLTGGDSQAQYLSRAEIYDPGTGVFTITGAMSTGRYLQTATRLLDGTVLVAGGGNSVVLASAEVYTPASLIPTNLVSITVMPTNPSVYVGDSLSFSAIGTFSDNSTEILTSATWSSSDNNVASITNDATNYGNAFAVGAGSATVNACTGTICGSTSLTVAPQPSISINPTNGPTGILLTITGSGFGNVRGGGSATIGGVPIAVYTWTDTQIVGAVAPNTNTGTVSVTQGPSTINGPTFTVTSSFPYQVTPQSLSMIVGSSRTVSVVDSNGNPVQGLYWFATDPTIVSLSTADPPIITALAPGTVTVYAGEVPIAITVYASGTAIPPGTPVWTNPPLPGFTLNQVVQAVPTANGPDLYSLEVDGNGNGQVRAFRSDGTSLWQQLLPGSLSGLGNLVVLMGDNTGGVVLFSAPTGQIADLSSQGQLGWQYSAAGYFDQTRGGQKNFAIGPNGTIYVVEDNYDGQNGSAFDTIDAGSLVSQIPLSISSSQETVQGNYDDCGLTPPFSPTSGAGSLGRPVVGPDGSVYLPVESSQFTETATWSTDPNQPSSCTTTYTYSENLSLLTLPQGGGSQLQQLASYPLQTNSYLSYFASGSGWVYPPHPQTPFYVSGDVIPDGNSGVLAKWINVADGLGGTRKYPVTLADIGQAGTTTTVLPSLQNSSSILNDGMVLGDNNSVFVTDGNNVASFDASSLQQNWIYPSSGGLLSFISATPSSGVLVNDSVQGPIQLDATGAPTSPIPSLQGAVPFDLSDWVSGSSGSASLLWDAYGTNGATTLLAQSVSPMPRGNAQEQRQPPFCQRANSNCVLAPNSDQVIQNPLVAGVKTREIQYELFSLQNGTLQPMGNNSQAQQTRISLLETNPTNPGTVICYWAGPQGSNCQSPNPLFPFPGFLEDDISQGRSGNNTAKQQFFVDRCQVKVYWPTDGPQPYFIKTWYGAWDQNASIISANAPVAIIQQNNPDMGNGVTCAALNPPNHYGCSPIQANGTP